MQGTANGYGERAGNADTFALIGNLVTKMGLPVVPAECLPELQRVSHAIAELANIAPDDHQPFVGASAFAHKAGLHASAIKVSPELYNHLDPAVVGNDMRILVTEMAGRASIELKGRELGVDLAGQADAIGRVVDQVKVLEADGWSFEAADASFELLLRAQLPDAPAPLFELESYRTSVEHWGNGVVVSEATVKVHARRRADHQHRRGQRPGQRAGQRAAPGAGQPVPGAGRRVAGRLQGAHPRLEGRHERHHAGAHRHHRRGGGVDHRRRPRQHRRGVLARAGRRPDLRRAAPAGPG